MAWKITIDDASMLLDDLSPEELDAVVAKHPETNWIRLLTVPAGNLSAFYSLLCAVAFKLEKPSPDRPATVRAARALLKHIEQVDDDLPTQFSEGGIPLEEADEPETTTSSTSTAPEVGAPSKPGARP